MVVFVRGVWTDRGGVGGEGLGQGEREDAVEEVRRQETEEK